MLCTNELVIRIELCLSLRKEALGVSVEELIECEYNEKGGWSDPAASLALRNFHSPNSHMIHRGIQMSRISG